MSETVTVVVPDVEMVETASDTAILVESTITETIEIGVAGPQGIPGSAGGSAAPIDGTYLVTTANASLTNEVVVGTIPGGELGGTWDTPTVDASHSGSTHAATQAAAEATAASALSGHTGDTSDAHDASAVSFAPAGTIAATDVQAAIEEVAAEAAGGAPTGADYLVGTANGGLSAEIVVGTSPGGELGGTWGSPTVDASHSGSTHAATQAAAESTAASALSAHDSDTTNVHGIADTAVLATDAELTAHADDTTAIHGIADTANLAPADATYLTTTAQGGLSAEVVVGTSPGGELGGTWASPTVDASHSGSTHAATQAAAESTAASALTAHDSDSTSVHGITDTAQLAFKNAANTFTTGPQRVAPATDLRPLEVKLPAGGTKNAITVLQGSENGSESGAGSGVMARIGPDGAIGAQGAHIQPGGNGFSPGLTAAMWVDPVDNVPGLLVDQASTTGTADLQRWRASDGTTYLLVNSVGLLNTLRGIQAEVGATASDTVLIKKLTSQTGRALRVVDTDGTTDLFYLSATGGIVSPTGAGNTNRMVIVAGPSMTGALTAWTAADGATIFSRINKDGFIMTRKNAAPADADVATGELAFWFDSTNGSAVLKAKAKQADGTVIDPLAGLGGGGGAPTDADYLVGTANGSLSGEIVVGTSPGGELGGTWASPTVDTTHSGSSHDGVVTTHEAAADPHTGYVLESLVDAAGDLYIGSAADTVARLARGSTDQVLAATASTVAWRSIFARRFKAGQYYIGGVWASDTGQPMTLDRQSFTAFPVGETQSFDRIGLQVTSGVASSVIRLGVYNSDDDGFPSTVNVDAGTVDSSTTGNKDATINITLTPGLYWIASCLQVAAGVSAKMGNVGISDQYMLPLGTTQSAADGRAVCLIQTGITGAFATHSGTANFATTAPLTKLRAS